jgi:hypothetical protein
MVLSRGLLALPTTWLLFGHRHDRGVDWMAQRRSHPGAPGASAMQGYQLAIAEESVGSTVGCVVMMP